MGMFNKPSTVPCPVCQEPLPASSNLMLHNLTHAVPTPDGGSGFIWSCGCGEQDGVWDTAAGAAAGLTQHMQRSHGFRV